MTNENLLALLGSVEYKLYYAKYIACRPDVWYREDFVPYYEQIYFITKGECIITIDGREYRPKKGQIIYIPAGQSMSYRMARNCELEKYWCHFNAQVAGRELLSFFQVERMVTLTPKEYQTFIEIFDSISPFDSMNTQSVIGCLTANVFINRILALFLELSHAQLKEEPTGSEYGFPAVLNYIAEHIDKNLTASELAAKAGLHPNYFIGRFRELYGYSPLQYVKKVRMEKAKKLLCNGDMTVGEVAVAVGFRDPLYFSSTFKSVCGFSPTEYRRMFI